MFRPIALIAILFLITACSRNSETWENMKTTGRYMQKGIDSMLGKDYESRMLSFGEDFYGPFDDDFIPLQDADLRSADPALLQPKEIPGQFGLPSLNAFYAPPEALKGVFCSIHFNTDEYIIRGRDEMATLSQLANYLKSHPNFYIVVEGHCDERASASYNLALGMRRANAVRSFLIKNGADLNRIYTISRGKEQPLALGHSLEDWKINRRSEFRVYQK